MGLHPAHHHRHLCATMDKLLLHGYCLGTAAWYTLRGGCRIWDPAMVVGWFRPPAQRHLEPNDLELYNVRTDAWGLLSLAGVMVTISQAVPYPRLFASTTSTDVKVGVKDDEQEEDDEAEEKQLIAPSIRNTLILVSIFHHITTGIGAFQHYKRDTHYNTSMGIGVWANAFLTVVGAATIFAGDRGVKERRKARKGRTVRK